jgi:crotonobetainyl-CoA:carnitine CoA-transferase CaiB-like acyl-CoA transferase
MTERDSDPQPGPLSGVRVLDFTQYVAGPYCTQILADLGATVLKVERPERGDIYREQGPVFLGPESASFLTLNRGKRSVQLDIGSAAGRAAIDALIAEADVLVENMRPGAMQRRGLAYEDLRDAFPELIYCSISAFGQDGPIASRGGYDLTVQALSGIMSMTGHPDQAPAKVPVAALDFGSALYAVIGILSALRQRERTGTGQWVRTSILETGLAWLSMHITTFLVDGKEPRRLGTRSPFFAPYEAYRTADGYLAVVGTGGTAGWPDFCEAIGVPELIGDPRFAANSDRVANAEALREELERVFGTANTDHWVATLEAADVPCAPVQSLSQVLTSDQVQALSVLDTVSHPTAGEVPIVRLPVTLSNAQTTTKVPPPLLGQHDGEGFGSADGAEKLDGFSARARRP